MKKTSRLRYARYLLWLGCLLWVANILAQQGGQPAVDPAQLATTSRVWVRLGGENVSTTQYSDTDIIQENRPLFYNWWTNFADSCMDINGSCEHPGAPLSWNGMEFTTQFSLSEDGDTYFWQIDGRISPDGSQIAE